MNKISLNVYASTDTKFLKIMSSDSNNKYSGKLVFISYEGIEREKLIEITKILTADKIKLTIEEME